ncbi:hypothetical protein EOD43_19380 [Sphingomonas crocodyli]|uniref:Uncharacterized protein n=1 Tax=Sphingomonas crocodyli TaxID=1979270 RepID=A0A437LYG8_9SPHN|nr:hypothetical protein EOD43_19380 [Sphingomonas crocodyli]
MLYNLYAPGAPDEALAQANLANDFAAEQWARQWVLTHQVGDEFTLRRADGGLDALVMRTRAGQCYVMTRSLAA